MKKALLVFLALLLTVSMFAGCASKPDTEQSPSPELPTEPSPEVSTVTESLVIAITKDENTLTPYTYVTGSPGLDVLRLIYDSLFTFDADNKIVPWMIEDDYTVDADSRVYTMTLKDGLFWHDGQPLTVEDVKFTFDYALTQSRSRWKNIANQIESFDISAGNVITIILKSGNPNYLRAGLCDMPIIPKHIYEGVEVAEGYAGDTIGSSLYKLVEYKIGEYYRFEAVEDYFKGTVHVSQINMPIMTDSAAVSQSLIAGQVMAATSSIAPETIDTFKSTAGIEILSGQGYGPTMLQFNCERDILSDAQFRRALAYAINIPEIIDTVMLGYAEIGLPGFYTADNENALTDLTYTFLP